MHCCPLSSPILIHHNCFLPPFLAEWVNVCCLLMSPTSVSLFYHLRHFYLSFLYYTILNERPPRYMMMERDNQRRKEIQRTIIEYI